MRIPFSSVITLFLIAILGLSCYEENGFSFDPEDAFTWFECPLMINSHPRLFLSEGSLDKNGKVIRLFNPNAIIKITDNTEGKSFLLKSKEKYFFSTDSMVIKPNHTYHLYINSNGKIYQDSANTFLTNAKITIGFKEVDPLNNVVEGFINSAKDESIRFIYTDNVKIFSYLDGNEFYELFPNINFRLRYFCGKPVQNTKINQSIYYASSHTYYKLNKIRNIRKEFNGISALYPPTNYDDNITHNKIGGFFGFVGLLQSNTLENLDNSEKIKSLRLLDSENQTDVSQDVSELDVSIHGKWTGLRIGGFLQISVNELDKLYLIKGENPYKCESLPYVEGANGVVKVRCILNGAYHIGLSNIKDLYTKEQIDIVLKKE